MSTKDAPGEVVYFTAIAVVKEAIHWYGRNPQADASVAEVIASALRDAGLLLQPNQKGDS